MVLPTIGAGVYHGRPGARDPDKRAGGTRGTLAIFTPSKKKKGKRRTKGSGICGRKGIKGVEKGDKAFLESLYYTKERVTMQLPMEERKVGDAGRTDGQMHGQRQLYTVGGA